MAKWENIPTRQISWHKESHGVHHGLLYWPRRKRGIYRLTLESRRARFERRSARSLARRFVSLGFS